MGPVCSIFVRLRPFEMLNTNPTNVHRLCWILIRSYSHADLRSLITLTNEWKPEFTIAKDVSSVFYWILSGFWSISIGYTSFIKDTELPIYEKAIQRKIKHWYSVVFIFADHFVIIKIVSEIISKSILCFP